MKDYWLVEANANNKNNAKIFVVGNKVDAKREVESFSLQTLKSSEINGFYEVSAKMNTNVQETFTSIAKFLHTNKPAGEDNKPKATRIKPPSSRKV